MTKTLNQILFPPPKSEYIFQQHWESEYFFKKKPSLSTKSQSPPHPESATGSLKALCGF